MELTQVIAGWGGVPRSECHLLQPQQQGDLFATLGEAQISSYISRGLGRSYGDAAQNEGAGVISHARLAKFLSFNAASGELHCEAGVTLGEILTFFLPRGFLPPVLPGTKHVTVGGAIANDIHGKNHHRDGSFGQFVTELTLLTADGTALICSPHQHADAFWATVGGIGLTGAILSARIRLMPVTTSYIRMDRRRAPNLDEALAMMEAGDQRHRYSVAWIDLLAKGRSLGRSVIMQGDHAEPGDLPPALSTPLTPPAVRGISLPFQMAAPFLRPFTVQAFNTLYYGVNRDVTQRITAMNPFFFPLDFLHNWNRLYGRRGFTQYQLALPFDRGREGLIEVLTLVGRSRRPSFLAVLKRFGEGSPGMLSFPMPGFTLTMDLPYTSDLVPFLHELDRILLRYGGRVYLAKDATLRPETFRMMYPQAARFLEVKRQLDPNSLFASSMSRRLGLVV